MSGRVPATLLWLAVLLSGSAQAAPPLELADAVARTLDANPALFVFSLRQAGLSGDREVADLRPALRAGAELENTPGTGSLRGADRSELTLTLSSVLELGGKRNARVALVDAARERNSAERRARALALVADTTRAFIETLAARERLTVAASAQLLAEQTLQTLALRVRRGLAPRPELLRAQAQLRVAELEVERGQRSLDANRMRLASSMGSSAVDFGELVGDLYRVDKPADFETLFARAEGNPSIEVLASEARLRQADFALARSADAADLSWNLGLRRLQEIGDTGLVASVSLPLGQRARNRGAVRSVAAARDEVPVRRDAALLALRARLYDAYQQRVYGITAMRTLVDQNLPELEEAVELTWNAYKAGRYTYLDLLATQSELLAARSRVIDLAVATAVAGVLIEQLTARSVAADTGMQE